MNREKEKNSKGIVMNKISVKSSCHRNYFKLIIKERSQGEGGGVGEKRKKKEKKEKTAMEGVRKQGEEKTKEGNRGWGGGGGGEESKERKKE